jgi:transcriptional regulator with XRE-family HTH domain
LSLKLNLSGWQHATYRHGLMTDADTARALGVSGATVSRIKSGKVAPSAEFIAAALVVLQGARFNDLFSPYRKPVTR